MAIQQHSYIKIKQQTNQNLTRIIRSLLNPDMCRQNILKWLLNAVVYTIPVKLIRRVRLVIPKVSYPEYTNFVYIPGGLLIRTPGGGGGGTHVIW